MLIDFYSIIRNYIFLVCEQKIDGSRLLSVAAQECVSHVSLVACVCVAFKRYSFVLVHISINVLILCRFCRVSFVVLWRNHIVLMHAAVAAFS